MDLEIWLDCEEVSPENVSVVEKKFKEWYAEGSEVRHNKMSFGSLTLLAQPNRYIVDLGYADPIAAFRNLHARLHRLGVKVFIHFIH